MTLWRITIAAAGSAVGGTVLLFILNAIWTVNGVGMIDRLLPEPFSTWWIGAGGGAVIGLLIPVRRKNPGQPLREWAQLHGFVFEEHADRGTLDYAGYLDVFKKWHKADNHLTGRLGDSAVEMVDLTSVERGSETTRYYRQTVVVLAGNTPDLPDFDLFARRFYFRLLEATGRGGMKFMAGVELAPGDTDAVARFNEQYILYPAGLGETVKPTMDGPAAWTPVVERLRSLFTLDLLRFFTTHPEWCVESQHGHLAIWKHKTVMPAAERQGLLDAVKEIRDALIQANDTSPTVGLEVQFAAPDRRTIQKKFHRFIACIGGGFFLGSFVGMAGFRNIDDFPWTFLAFIGPIIVGTLFGGFVAWKLAQRY